MANITRIKAKDDAPAKKSASKPAKKPQEPIKAKKPKTAPVDKKVAKKAEKAAKKAAKQEKRQKNPGYFRGAVQEIRQVRWPNRKETWKLTISVIIYVVLIAVAVMLLDALLTFLFNKLIGGNM